MHFYISGENTVPDLQQFEVVSFPHSQSGDYSPFKSAYVSYPFFNFIQLVKHYDLSGELPKPQN